MARFTDASIERLRDALDMVEIVSARTELRRAGANRYTGLCPFHEERTPSFGIDPVEKLYHCFGCQASGDIFKFVMETEGLGFRDAVEMLAGRAGVTLEVEDEDPRDAERRQRRERLLELLERTAAYYVRYLWESAEAAAAREYLASRGLEEAILREFRVGYSPSAWDRVLVRSREARFGDSELLATGLAQRSSRSGQLYDRFRGRVMFPLADQRGRVLGFGARGLRENQRPKYLNTSEGEVYHKGRQLFGADVARVHATREGSVIVVEGYTDVLALHQAGVRNAVAIMGTALTEDQLGELGRLASTVALALDADSAGQEAMVRAAGLARGRGLELRVVRMPVGTDPAELVQSEGAEAMRARVGASVPFVRFHVERIVEGGDLTSAEGKDRMLDELRPVVGALGPSAMREELLRFVASRLELSERLMETLVEGAGRGGAGAAGGGAARGGSSGSGRPVDGGGGQAAAAGASGGAGGAAPAPRLDRRERTERAFLVLCIALPEPGRAALAAIDPDAHFTSDLARRAALHLREHLESPREGLPAGDEELARLVADLTVRADVRPSAEAMLEMEHLQLEKARLEREISAAREAGRTDVPALAAARAEVQRRLDAVMDRVMESDPAS
jgi:DNA primase